MFNDFHGSTASYLTISACGMMIGTAYLLMASVEYAQIISMMIGFVTGRMEVYISSVLIQFAKPKMTKANQHILIEILTMKCHRLGEGSSIGVESGTNRELSSNDILSLALHNIPEGHAT
eukprot:783138_1